MSQMFKDNVGLSSQIEEQREEQRIQQELKKKHNIDDENIVVVEKPSLTKFVIKTCISMFKVIATILILCLATICLLGIIYPDPRIEIVKLLVSIFDGIVNML